MGDMGEEEEEEEESSDDEMPSLEGESEGGKEKAAA